MRILLTGITGVLGEPLATRLLIEPEVEQVIGVSRRPLTAPLARHPRLEHLRCDFRAAPVIRALSRVDCVVHCAFLPYGRNQRKLIQVNVDGSNYLHRSAIDAGVRHLVFVSSQAAYGSHRDNPVPLTESCPLRPNPESFYSAHKAAVEFELDQLQATVDGLVALRPRPCVMVGPRADAGTEAIRFYYHVIVPNFRDERWLWQFVRTSEAAKAIARAVTTRLDGPLNVASGDWLTYRELAAVTGGRMLNLPPALRPVVPLAKALHLSPVGRDRSILLRNPMVVSNRRMRERTGVAPIGSEAALREFLRYPS